jgi:hypothetical protein
LLDFDHPTIKRETKNAKFPEKKYSQLYKDVKYIRSAKCSPRESFVILCQINLIILLKRSLKSVSTSTRNYERFIVRRMSRNPYLLRGLGGSETPVNYLKLLMQDQTGDPNTQELSKALSDHLLSRSLKGGRGTHDP